MDESSLEKLSVIVRPYNPHFDSGLLYGYWRNSVYYSSAEPIPQKGVIFFREFTDKIQKVLKRPDIDVKIACLEDSPGMILGFSVSEKKHLYFIFVKPEYRRCGIGTLLMPEAVESVEPPLTKIGQWFNQKYKWLVKEKGEKKNEERETPDDCA